MTPPQNEPRRPRPRKHWLRWTLLSLVLLLIVGGVTLWLLATGKPNYYRRIDPQDPVVQKQAERFEQAMTTHATRVRPTEEATWQVQVDQAQVNDWLAARLPQWLANQGINPAEIAGLKQVMVGFIDGQVELAAEADALGTDAVLRLIYEPKLNGGVDPVTLELTSIRSGHLPLPKQRVLDAFIQHAPDEQSRNQMLEARRAIESLELILPLGDGRVVSIVDMAFNDTGVLLTCRTQRLPARAANE